MRRIKQWGRSLARLLKFSRKSRTSEGAKVSKAESKAERKAAKEAAKQNKQALRNAKAALKEGKALLKSIKERQKKGEIIGLAGDLQRLHWLVKESTFEPRSGEFSKAAEAIASVIVDDGSLLTHGPQVAPRREQPLYDPHDKTVFYLLNSIVPLRTNGYGTRSHSLLKALRQEGWNVIGVVKPRFPFDTDSFKFKVADQGWAAAFKSLPPAEYEHDGVPYIYNPVPPTEPLKVSKSTLIREFADFVIEHAHRHRPAVIHAASNYLVGQAAVLAGRELGIPVIYEIRGLWELTAANREPAYEGTDQYNLQGALEAHTARSADSAFAITGAVADILAERGADRGRFKILSNAVNPEVFHPIPRDKELEERHQAAGKVVIGYGGSITRYEGLELLLEAMAGLPLELREQARVVIVGGAPHLQHFRKTVAEIVAKSEGTLTVDIVGEVPFSEMQRYYSLFDIAPLPRTKCLLCDTVSPLKPFELMAMEKAIIASDVHALSEIVNDGHTGLLHRADNVDSLREGLARLISDAALRERLGKTARQWVVTERTWASAAAKVGAEYAELISKSRQGKLGSPC